MLLKGKRMSTTDEMASAEEKKRILVVEDNVEMCRMLAQLLGRAGYQVVLAEDGQIALTQAQQHHPHLILLDMSLPKVSGWEAVGLLRKMPEFHETPIIAVTAHVSTADQERALAAGCNAHIGKPFRTKVLLEKIVDLLPRE